MRGLTTSFLALCLAACTSPNGEYDAPVEDGRYDLIASQMPDILTSDAKQCAKVINFARGERVENGSAVEQAFSLTVDFWQVVDEDFLSKDDVADVLPAGGNPEAVPSILPSGVRMPTKVAEACGKYAGETLVTMGILSLSDTIEMALEQDPDIFKDMGMNAAQVRQGVEVISAQAAPLVKLPHEHLVSCVAIYQAATKSDLSLKPRSTVWMAALVQAIDAGGIDPKKIKEKSAFWRLLESQGVDAVMANDGYQSKASECDASLDGAINAAAAGESQ
jgi:hypothetical protein